MATRKQSDPLQVIPGIGPSLALTVPLLKPPLPKLANLTVLSIWRAFIGQ